MSQVSSTVDVSSVASLASDRHPGDPSPTPLAFYACTICSRDGSVPPYPAPLSAILVNTHPVSTFTAVHGQPNQIEAVQTLAGGLLGSFSTLLSCILNHTPPPPPPPSLHKRNNRSLKRRRGGGGEESLFPRRQRIFPSSSWGERRMHERRETAAF